MATKKLATRKTRTVPHVDRKFSGRAEIEAQRAALREKGHKPAPVGDIAAIHLDTAPETRVARKVAPELRDARHSQKVWCREKGEHVEEAVAWEKLDQTLWIHGDSHAPFGIVRLFGSIAVLEACVGVQCACPGGRKIFACLCACLCECERGLAQQALDDIPLLGKQGGVFALGKAPPLLAEDALGPCEEA